MIWPDPHPGLVIRYAYLWKREAEAGHEEGIKSRPCAVVATVLTRPGVTRIVVLPITHAPPRENEPAVELPSATKARLGLDSERSWVLLSEANSFVWPGPDLMPHAGAHGSAAYGVLPPALFRVIRTAFLAHIRMRQSSVIDRGE